MLFAIGTVSVCQALLIRFRHPLASPKVQKRCQAKLVRRVAISVEAHFDGVCMPTDMASAKRKQM